MTTTEKLDLAQFEVGSDRAGFFIAAPNAESAYALLAECRRQREQITALREALVLITDSDGFMGGTFTKELQGIARAALAEGGKP